MKSSLAEKFKAIKNNKPLFALLIVAAVLCLVDIAYGAYIAAVIVMMYKGLTLYPDVLTGISIAALVLNAVFMGTIILYFILRRR